MYMKLHMINVENAVFGLFAIYLFIDYSDNRHTQISL